MGNSKKPNIIFILTDDQGPWAMGCAGNPEIRTPSLDRIAATGTRFENFFCTSPVCSPSRASFMTGRIPSQHGVHDWISGGNLPPDEIDYLTDITCYTDILAKNGYTCGISGKWHLGYSRKPQASFSHWYVHQRGSGWYNDAPMVRDGEFITEPGYITDAITDEALKYLDAHSSQTFYLSVHYTAPHSPWEGHPQDIVDSYDDCPFESCPQEPKHPWARELTDRCLGNREMLKGYFSAVTAMDANVGRILDRVEELGLRNDTLIAFFSDNGFSCGHHGFWGKGNGTSPQNMYDNSVKIPAIFSHPGRIPEGVVTDAMASAHDFMPTLLDYVNVSIPDDPTLPGRSFVPVLEGKSSKGRDNVIVYDEYGPVRMIRTDEWKYVHRYEDGPHELFDLVNDPGERENRIDEPGRAKRISEMKARLEEWFSRYVDPVRDGRIQPVAGFGQFKPAGPEPDVSAFRQLDQK